MEGPDTSLSFDCVIPGPEPELPSWPSKAKKGGNLRHKFSKTEDEALRRLVAEHGESNWATVAACMKNRTPRQCRERFKNYLSPAIKNGPWTPEEEALLEQKYREIGPKWAKIALFFEQRSDVNVKNHWTAMVNRQGRERQMSAEKSDVLQQLEAPGRTCCPFPEICAYPPAALLLRNQIPMYVGVQMPMCIAAPPPPMVPIMPMIPVISQIPPPRPRTATSPEPLVAPRIHVPEPKPRPATVPDLGVSHARAEVEGDSISPLWENHDDISFQFENSFDTSFDSFM